MIIFIMVDKKDLFFIFFATGRVLPRALRSLLLFSSCIRNLVSIKVPQGVSELCEISKI